MGVCLKISKSAIPELLSQDNQSALQYAKHSATLRTNIPDLNCQLPCYELTCNLERQLHKTAVSKKEKPAPCTDTARQSKHSEQLLICEVGDLLHSKEVRCVARLYSSINCIQRIQGDKEVEPCSSALMHTECSVGASRR
jgi:hypothetical protein